MSTTYVRGAGVAADPTRPAIAMTAAERAAFAHFEAFVDDRSAISIEVDAQVAPPLRPRFHRGLRAGDAPVRARLLDRVGDRIFTPEPIKKKHPIVVTDSITGRPVMAFGAGGAFENEFTSTETGTLYCASRKNAAGEEVNALPLFVPATGWTVAFKVRVPEPNTTVNGLDFVGTGGAVIGGMDADNDLCPVVWIGDDSGYLRLQNRYGVTSANQWMNYANDYRDGDWHAFVASYNHSAGTYKAWVDGNSLPTVSGVTTDIYPGADSGKPMIGGFSAEAVGPQKSFRGFLAYLAFMPGSILESAAQRNVIFDLMDTK